jgi:hypothetical protein
VIEATDDDPGDDESIDSIDAFVDEAVGEMG